MPTFKIRTLGCKVNLAESDAIAYLFKKQGYQAAAGTEPCDVCVVNTCMVTQKGAMQSRQEIRRIIRANPKARIIVTGCYAGIGKDELHQIPGIHHIVENPYKLSIPELILSQAGESLCVPQKFPEGIKPSRTRPFLKIQDGCNAFCSYCIVPLARGRSISMPFSKVLESLTQLKRDGYREAVLTGIHIGCYGQDLNPKRSLEELLLQIKQINPIDRIRLSSIEPLELTETIISTIIDNEIFCDHFHIPLQNGDDAILHKMRRPYTSRQFVSKIELINRLSPHAAIGVDVLAGFPGETDQSFQKTYALLESIPLAYFHVFPFSAREGTAAFDFPDKVAADVAKSRCHKLRMLGVEKKKAFFNQAEGTKAHVLFEGRRDKPTGLLIGYTSNYIKVLADNADHWMNRLVEVKLDLFDEKRMALIGHL